MEIFCKKCGNVQDKTPDDLIGEFCICDYCATLFQWYIKNETQPNNETNKKSEEEL
ncbi:MAG: hypothetical protein KAS18_06315 [Calditrichia bacterium]|nr:hypothetical protein [Calditrichia bacterium]